MKTGEAILSTLIIFIVIVSVMSIISSSVQESIPVEVPGVLADSEVSETVEIIEQEVTTHES